MYLIYTLYNVYSIQNPNILKSVQRSAQAVLVGRPILPQWLNQGIPVNSCVDSFTLSFPSGICFSI